MTGFGPVGQGHSDEIDEALHARGQRIGRCDVDRVPRELDGLLAGVGFVDIESRSFLTGVMSYHISRKPRR